MRSYPATVVRVATVAFSLALLAAAPASPRSETAPTHYYRVTAGSMTIETRDELGFEQLYWVVPPHARGTRPAPGYPTADGSGGPRSFQLRFPVLGTYAYDRKEEGGSDCKEAIVLTQASRATATARKVGSRVRFSWGLDPRRRARYIPHECRPQTNNALAYFLANQPATTFTLGASALGRPIFTVSVRGTRTGPDATTTWRVSLTVRRLGVR